MQLTVCSVALRGSGIEGTVASFDIDRERFGVISVAESFSIVLAHMSIHESREGGRES